MFLSTVSHIIDGLANSTLVWQTTAKKKDENPEEKRKWKEAESVLICVIVSVWLFGLRQGTGTQY